MGLVGQKGRGGAENGKTSSSVQAYNRVASVATSTGATTECSPLDELDGEEVYIRRATKRDDAKVMDALPNKSGRAVMPDVGRRVRVFWDGEGAWFDGVAEHIDEKSGLVYVLYDDGDESWEALGTGGTTPWEYAEDVMHNGGVTGDVVGVVDVAVMEAKGQSKENSNGNVRAATTNDMDEFTSAIVKPAGQARAAIAAPMKRKRKKLVGVDDACRGQMEFPAGKGRSPMVSPTAVAGDAATPSGSKKKSKRLQALIGGHRRNSLFESPQPGNVTNHVRRALESAKNTPDSGPSGMATAAVRAKKGPVGKTKMAPAAKSGEKSIRTTEAKVTVAKAPIAEVTAPYKTRTAPKGAPKWPKTVPPKTVAPKTVPAKQHHQPSVPTTDDKRKRSLTLGDTYDLSSNPSDDDEEDNAALDVNITTAGTRTAFTARDTGDAADILAHDALNEAFAKAYDSHATLVNTISHQKLSVLKLEMKHALEEATGKAKARLAEVTHAARLSCTIATDTLHAKISEMETFMRYQKETFTSMRRQALALQKKAEETVRAGEAKMNEVHDRETGSLRKLDSELYDKFVEGVAYIKNYSARMGMAGGMLGFARREAAVK